MLKIAYTKGFRYSLPQGHRFPMIKYDLIPEQLLYEGTITTQNLFEPIVPEDLTPILFAHTSEYWHRLSNCLLSKSEIRKIGFPLTRELVQREVQIAFGTIEACQYALKYGIAMNVAGGTHHAFSDRGEGFCMLNDQAIGSFFLLENELCKRVLIVDLDVHQGNGTAEIMSKNPNVFTFSMHGTKNYPLFKEVSDLDIPLDDGCGDEKYLAELTYHLPRVVEMFQPDFVFYQSGVDVLETDKLGRLSLSREGCKNRDRFVLEICVLNHIPLMISMGGGYSERLVDITEAHANTYRLAQEMFF